MLLAQESISAINPGNPVRTAAAHKLRAVVVDRSSSYVAVICALLEFDDVVDVVGMASNGVDALKVTQSADLILVDVERQPLCHRIPFPMLPVICPTDCPCGSVRRREQLPR